MRALVDAYASIDPRALGLFRLAFGAVLLGDLLARWADVSLFYSNEGLLSSHFNAFHPPSRPMFSLLTAFASPGEVKAAFAGFGLVYFLHMVGAFTGVTRVLVPVLCASLTARNALVVNAGASVMTLVALWTAFMPLGARFSVDAVRASLRDRPERDFSELSALERPRSAWVSVAALGVLLELVAIYGLNSLQKSGDTWRSGEAFHDVLWQDRLVTGAAAWLRAREAPWLSPLVSTGVRVMEAGVALLLLLPFRREWTRPLAVAGIFVFHGASLALFSLGALPWVMMATALLMLPASALDWLGARVRRLSTPVAFTVDPRTPGQGWTLRTLSRLDTFGLLTLSAGDQPLDDRALARAAAALPFGRCVAPVLGWLAPALSRVAERVAAASESPRVPAPRSPLGEQIAGTVASARESLAGVFLVAALMQISQENRAVPAALRFGVPPQLAPLAGYAGIHRRWSLFAPDAPRRDGALVIDARTEDGRRIDPLSGRAPLDDPRGAGPAGLGQLRCDYALNLSLDSNAAYREELRRWLRAWRGPEGRAEDRLVSFVVSWVTWETPRPGRPAPGPVDRRVLLTFPTPAPK
ncbi:MAG: HTTM domain-containing protein [Polyangiaceae bacterium]|nr:HTTM domain-containing protein [Polyangiaceae bacterium]